MAQTFRFELVSPEEKLISEDVAMVTVPAEEGAIGVLAGHAPLLTSLLMGVVEVRKGGLNDNNPRRVFVAGGFADIGADHCTVLAEEAVDVASLNAVQLDSQIASVQAAISVASDAFEKQRLRTSLDVLNAKRAVV